MLRKYPVFLLFAMIPLLAHAQLNVQWVGRYTTAGNNTDRARAMVLDANGNTCMTGTSWNGSNFDIVTTKFDTDGNLLWTVTFNGAANDFDEARAIALDTAGNIIVTGTTATTVTNYDIAVIKYNASGVLLWDTIYNGPGNNYDEPLDVITSRSGNIYITGGSDGSGTGSDVVTIAYTPGGTQLWATRYTGGGANIDAGKAITLDTTGNVYVTGTTRTSSVNNQDIITLKYNSAGVQQWFQRLNGPGSVYDEGTDIVVNDTGRVFVCGYVRALTGITNYDYITLSYSTTGTLLWQQSFNAAGNENDRANKIALTPYGKVVVTGRSLGSAATAEDCTTIMYDAATGTPQWTRTYDGGIINYDDGRNLLCDNLGNVFVTGYSFTAGQNHNYLLLEYDSLGNQMLLERWNGSGNNSDQAYSIGYDTLGSVYLGGMSRGAGTGEDYAVVKFCRLEADAGIDTSVCLGASVQLQAASSFGGIDSVWWVPAAGLSNPNIVNPIATPSSSTCYTVFIRNVYGCINADTVCITLYPLPGPAITSSGPLSICLGDSVSLTAQDTIGGPIAYLWNTGDTTQTITTDTSGTFIVTITNANTCSSQSQATVNVNALPNVSAGNDVGFCASTTVTLCATGALDYAWTPAFGLSDTTIACPVAGPTQSTTYIVYGTDANGCVNSDTVNISLYPFTPVPVISQNVAVLTSTPAATYQWYFNGNPIAGATQQSYTPTQNGSYYVVITDTNGCSSFSSTFTLADVGITTANAETWMQLYPNPNNGNFALHTTLEGKEAELLITSADGRLLHQQVIPAGSSTPLNIELPQADAGVYLLTLRAGDGSVKYGRFVISR